MKCPNCQKDLSSVQVPAHYSGNIIIDQCPSCGGIWFDADEFYQVRQGEAEKIDKLDDQKFKTLSLIRKTPFACPKDGSELIIFKDLNFPKNIIVESCPKCGGFWFNYGEFSALQVERQKKSLPKNLDPDLENQLQSIMDAYGQVGTYDTLGQLGTFLSTPMDRMSFRAIGQNKQSNRKVNLVIDLVSALFRVLLRH